MLVDSNLKLAIKRISKDELIEKKSFLKNRTFKLEHLFYPNEWEKMSVAERLDLGKRFKKFVEEGKVKDVIFIKKDSENHSHYTKK